MIHVYPREDLRAHVLTEGCWCCPVADAQEPDVMIHNSMDRREEYEAGRKPS